MIDLVITATGKSFSPRDKWRIMYEHVEHFCDMKAAREWIAKQYGKSKRVKMYRDRKDGTAVHCGYIIGYRNADWSHAPVDKWLQQDWIEFRDNQILDLNAA